MREDICRELEARGLTVAAHSKSVRVTGSEDPRSRTKPALRKALRSVGDKSLREYKDAYESHIEKTYYEPRSTLFSAGFDKLSFRELCRSITRVFGSAASTPRLTDECWTWGDVYFDYKGCDIGLIRDRSNAYEIAFSYHGWHPAPVEAYDLEHGLAQVKAKIDKVTR